MVVPGEYVSLDQLAQRLDLPKRAVKTLAEAFNLPHKPSRHYLFTAIEAVMMEQIHYWLSEGQSIEALKPKVEKLMAHPDVLEILLAEDAPSAQSVSVFKHPFAAITLQQYLSQCDSKEKPLKALAKAIRNFANRVPETKTVKSPEPEQDRPEAFPQMSPPNLWTHV